MADSNVGMHVYNEILAFDVSDEEAKSALDSASLTKSTHVGIPFSMKGVDILQGKNLKSMNYLKDIINLGSPEYEKIYKSKQKEKDSYIGIGVDRRMSPRAYHISVIDFPKTGDTESNFYDLLMNSFYQEYFIF